MMTADRRRFLRVIGLVCLAAIVLTTAYLSLSNMSLAWFVKTKQSDQLEFRSGKLHYILESAPLLNADETTRNIIVPGENLFSKIILTNKSTIASDMRLQISYTNYADPADEVGSVDIYGANPPIDKLLVGLTMLAAPELTQGFFWDGEKYWQWDDVPTCDAVKNPDGDIVPIMPNSPPILQYDGERAGNEFNWVLKDAVLKPKPITVTLTFQMKQRDSLDWETAFVISRSTQSGE